MIKFFKIVFFLLLNLTLFAENNNEDLSLMNAIEMTLKNNYDIKIQKQILDQSKNQNLIQKGVYDYIIGTSVSFSKKGIGLNDYNKAVYYSNYNSLYDRLYSEAHEYSIFLQKEMRFGTKFFLKGSYIRDNDLTNAANAGNPEYYEKLSLTIEQPLLKNVGKNQSNINEVISEIMYDKNKIDFQQMISIQMNSLIQSYWNYVYAVKNLEILKSAEDKYNKLIDKIKVLINNGERPAAELDQLIADLAVKKSYVVSGEQFLYETKEILSVLTGTNINLIGRPTNEFEKLINSKLKKLDYYIKTALNNRCEIKNIEKQIMSAELVMKKSKIDLRPDLNLMLDGEINNSKTGTNYPKPFTDNEKGWKIQGSLNLSFPIKNRQNIAMYRKNIAEYKRLILKKNDLINKIRSEVSIAYYNLKNSLSYLNYIAKAVNGYEKAVNNIKKKYDLGMATIIEVTLTEDKLINALQNKLSAHNKNNKAICELSYQTGELVKFRENQLVIKNEYIKSDKNFNY